MSTTTTTTIPSTAILGTVVLAGIITPSDTRDTYAVTDAIYGKDGLRNVDTIAEMLAITKDRRRIGMMVGVGITATSGNYYYLINDPAGDTTLITDWKTFQPGGSITFFDEGTNLGSFTKVRFSGSQVLSRQDAGDADLLNVFIPPPTFASNFTQQNGVGNGTVTESIVRGTARISTPTSEGSPGTAPGVPFKTGGWAGTTQSATNISGVSFTTVNPVTGFGGNSKIQVELFDGDNVKIADYTTPNLIQNGSNTSTSPFGIAVAISDFADDSSRKKAKPTISVFVNTILNGLGSQVGGRYRVKITHFTDTATDGSTWIYEQDEVFLDAGGSSTLGFGTPSTRTITEFNQSTTTTKFLSGVQYYTTGSRFSVTMTNIAGLNRNSQGRQGSDGPNFTVSAPNYGLPQINQRAWAPTQGSFENWTNAWDSPPVNYFADNWIINATAFRYRGPNGAATGQPFDPWTAGPTGSTATRPILVDTFGTTSTISIEDFNDESRRLTSSYLSWDSGLPLQNGEACVVGGSLVRPDQFFLTDPTLQTIQPDLSTYFPQKGGPNPNYTNFSQEAKYFRKFQTGNSLLFPSFILNFSGNFPGGSARAALTSEALKIFVRREQSADQLNPSGPSSNPLRLHGSTEFNSSDFDDGQTVGGSYIRTNAYLTEPNTIEGSLGGRDGLTGILIELVIASPAIRIDRIEFIPEQS
jgi:hypothetical protein